MEDFNIKDDYSIVKVRKSGLILIITTGRSGEIEAKCRKELSISILHRGISDKLSKLEEIAAFPNLSFYNIAYIGDDLNNLDRMKAYDYSACPADTISQVRTCVDYICQVRGSEGVVREMLDSL